MSERDRYPQDRDPFDNLRDLIDQPATPRQAFADELRSRLMRELSASEFSREEHSQAMNAVSIARPPVAFPIESPRRIRPMVILELAAAAIIILGLAATVGRGWFQNDPDAPTSVPAAALQGDGTPTPDATMPPTVEPSVVPPGNLAGTLWTIPGPDGDLVDFGGLLVEDGTVFRLIATTGFVGIQAVNSDTGTVEWQQAYQWTGNLFALEKDTLYFDGGDNQLIAVNAETGVEQWRAQIGGNPIALTEENDRIFVLTDSDFVNALDRATGAQLWVAQGTVPQNPTGGSTRIPAIGTIAVAGDTVAAISSSGVLSGFDVATGDERWSHEGYDASSVTIGDEDDRFIVTSGSGLMSMSARVGLESTPDDSDDCAMYFEGAVEAGAQTGTPEAGASRVAVPGTTFGAEAIDPATGDIVWSQQAVTGDEAAAISAANAANPVACVIDSETGRVGIDPSGREVITINDDSSDSFQIAQSIVGGDAPAIIIGRFADANEQPIAAAAEDGAVYLQLADGSLMKVDAGQVQGEAGYQESSDDHGESGTTESDDD